MPVLPISVFVPFSTKSSRTCRHRPTASAINCIALPLPWPANLNTPLWLAQHMGWGSFFVLGNNSTLSGRSTHPYSYRERSERIRSTPLTLRSTPLSSYGMDSANGGVPEGCASARDPYPFNNNGKKHEVVLSLSIFGLILSIGNPYTGLGSRRSCGDRIRGRFGKWRRSPRLRGDFRWH